MKITQLEYRGQVRFSLSGYLGGRNVRKWFHSQDAANTWWNTKQKEVKRNAGAVLMIPDGERAVLVAAADVARKGGFDVLTAVNYYAQHLATRPQRCEKVLKAVDLFVTACTERKLRERSVKSLENVLDAFAVKFGAYDVDAISATDIKDWCDPDWSAGTFNGYLTRISTFFGWCVRQGYCKENVVEKVDRKKVERDAPCVFSVDDVSNLLATTAELDPELLPFVALGIFCGIRPAELARLEWSDINTDERIVTVGASQAKTGERRHVHLCDAALAFLAKCDKMPALNLRKRMEHVRNEAGIAWGDDIMRHTFASYHVAHHKDASRTAFELGHRGDAQLLFTHYRNLVKPSDAAAFWDLRPETVKRATKIVQLAEVA